MRSLSAYLYERKLRKNNIGAYASVEGVDATLVTGKKMNHVWPLYPIREAETALDCIAGFLLKD